MENFSSSPRIEPFNRRGLYKTRKEVESDGFDYNKRLRNPKRRDSTIEYMSLVSFEPARYARNVSSKSVKAQGSEGERSRDLAAHKTEVLPFKILAIKAILILTFQRLNFF